MLSLATLTIAMLYGSPSPSMSVLAHFLASADRLAAIASSLSGFLYFQSILARSALEMPGTAVLTLAADASPAAERRDPERLPLRTLEGDELTLTAG